MPAFLRTLAFRNRRRFPIRRGSGERSRADHDVVDWMASFATKLFPFGRMEAGDGHTLFSAEQFRFTGDGLQL